MTGEPVNIVLKGQKEMCEREPESTLKLLAKRKKSE